MFNRMMVTLASGGAVVTGFALASRNLKCGMHLDGAKPRPWNYNWDHREPDLTNNNAQLPTAVRHLILVRHGQYVSKSSDEDCVLTPLGREQADLTGRRLNDLNLPVTRIVNSTMTRAIETADIICKHLSGPREKDVLICEGAPYPPEPPHAGWKPEDFEFFQEGAIIEAGFRKYFHRADPSQRKDSYEVLVCHGNVIRYCLSRALQLPTESWLRYIVCHGSITWITIYPDGEVTAKCVGDFGYMPRSKVTA